MTEQQGSQEDRDGGPDDDQEPELDADVVRDLDVAAEDADVVRCGPCDPPSRMPR